MLWTTRTTESSHDEAGKGRREGSVAASRLHRHASRPERLLRLPPVHGSVVHPLDRLIDPAAPPEGLDRVAAALRAVPGDDHEAADADLVVEGVQDLSGGPLSAPSMRSRATLSIGASTTVSAGGPWRKRTWSSSRPNRAKPDRTMFRSAIWLAAPFASRPSAAGLAKLSTAQTRRSLTSCASRKPRRKMAPPPRPTPHSTRSPSTEPPSIVSRQRWR